MRFVQRRLTQRRKERNERKEKTISHKGTRDTKKKRETNKSNSIAPGLYPGAHLTQGCALP
jgi:hypothetical protein